MKSTKTVEKVKTLRVKKTIRKGRSVKTVETTKSKRRVTIRIKRPPKPHKRSPLVVTLPEVPAVPAEKWGEPYTIQRLLTDGEDNPKLSKSNAASSAYRTWGLTLAPANQSGYQTCASASPGCKKACLNNQGQARVFPSIYQSRVAKTVAFFEHREAFLGMLQHEVAGVARLGERKEFTPAIRLNVLSDILWEKVAPWIFTDFSVQFYDYTKHVVRMLRWCQGQLPSNYHLTFSRSERNEADCLRVLAAGGTVAVVFATKDIPATWQGYPVLNGDETDLRFTDRPGHIVGLYAKGTASRDTSGFVVPVRGVMSLKTVN